MCTDDSAKPWKDRTTGKTMYREIKGKFKPSEKKGPPNAYGSHTTHGIVFKDVHTGETCDARGQAHISFSPTRWARNSKPDEDDRTFAAIRKDGAKFPKLESIKGLRKTMIHEVSCSIIRLGVAVLKLTVGLFP